MTILGFLLFFRYTVLHCINPKMAAVMVRTCMVVQDSSGCACHCLSLMHRIMLGHLEPYTIHISPESLKECGFPAVFPTKKTGKQVPCCRQQGCFARAVVVSTGFSHQKTIGVPQKTIVPCTAQQPRPTMLAQKTKS